MTKIEEAIKAIIDFGLISEQQYKDIKIYCLEEINDDFKLNEEYCKGEIAYEDYLSMTKKASSLAHDILKILGYEVDHYFCGHAILKEIEEDNG